MKKTAIIIGATGLVGSHILQQLLKDDRYATVKVLHRRTTGIDHPKLEEHIINFDQPENWSSLVTGTHLFSALGTTKKKAASQEEQYKVDNTYQYEVAKAAAHNNVQCYALISSAGADSSSSNFYLRMKGELDDAVAHLDFTYQAIFRPSFLEGSRNEFRPLEKMGIFIARLLSWIPGIRKYRPIRAELLARAMINDLNTHHSVPRMIYEKDQIFELL